VAPVPHTDRGESSVAGELGLDEFGQIGEIMPTKIIQGGMGKEPSFPRESVWLMELMDDLHEKAMILILEVFNA